MYVVTNQELLDQKRYELSTERQRGAVADVHKIEALEQELVQLENNKVEENNEEIANWLDELTATDGEDQYTMRALTYNESAYQILRATIQENMMLREEKLIKEMNRVKEEAAVQIAQIQAAKDQLQMQYDSLYEEAAALKNELNAAREEAAENARKRDAAANELDTANKEIARLNSHIDDLRIENAVGASNAPKVVNTNTTADLAEAMKQFKESRPAIYDVVPADNKGSLFRAKLAETDEEITFGWLERGKYREVTAEAASTFRAAAEEKRRNEDLARRQEELEESLTPPSLQFQEETDGTEYGLDQTDADGTLEGQAAPTVEERLTALEQRVSVLEKERMGEAA